MPAGHTPGAHAQDSPPSSPAGPLIALALALVRIHRGAHNWTSLTEVYVALPDPNPGYAPPVLITGMKNHGRSQVELGTSIPAMMGKVGRTWDHYHALVLCTCIHHAPGTAVQV